MKVWSVLVSRLVFAAGATCSPTAPKQRPWATQLRIQSPLCAFATPGAASAATTPTAIAANRADHLIDVPPLVILQTWIGAPHRRVSRRSLTETFPVLRGSTGPATCSP